MFFFFFQAEDGIRDLVRSRGLGDVYKRQASDWAWGTPSHPSINTAAEGTKGWFVGSLSGTYYEFGQQSWLESPCFDFTALQYPYISFKLYWECERQYDGLGFQYSLCLLYTSPSPRDRTRYRMPSSA